MQHEYRFEIEYRKGLANQQTIKIDLDLTLRNFLESKERIEVELALRETEIRKEIFQLVIGQIVPPMLKATDMDWQLPAGRFQSQCQSSTHSKWHIADETENTLTAIRNQMEVVLEIEVDKPVNAMQALYTSRAELASAVTCNIIDSLKKRYLGITESETTYDTHVSGDQVVDLQMRS